jgi:hypothetical protein
MAKKKLDGIFLQPEITQAGEFQVLTIKGKDTRGYDWKVRLAPISKKTVPGDLPETANADRIEVYAGGKPKEIDKISGEIEVTLGKEEEPHRIKEASIVYIPKGTPVQHRVINEPKETAFLLNFTLTPKYEPAKNKKGGK